MSDKVTILIPCYQHGPLLGRAVASALAQTHRELEIIIINDGATDSTGEVASELAGRHPGRIEVIEQSNRGQAWARQAGLEAASGDFLVMLDADDELEPEMVASALRTFRAYPRADVVVGDAWLVGGEDGQTILGRYEQGHGVRWPRVLEYNPMGAIVAIMARTESVRRVGGVAVDGRAGCEDWDLWIRMARCRMTFARVGRPIGRYRHGPRSASRRSLAMLRSEIELLERCRREDPRLGGVGLSPATSISQRTYGRLRNGRVFRALGVAIATEAPAEEVESILEYLTPGPLPFRFCTMQFVWGLQVDGQVAPQRRKMLIQRTKALLPAVGRHLERIGLGGRVGPMEGLLRRGAADPTFQPTFWERLRDKITGRLRP
jgi:hypothetical protein